MMSNGRVDAGRLVVMMVVLGGREASKETAVFAGVSGWEILVKSGNGSAMTVSACVIARLPTRRVMGDAWGGTSIAACQVLVMPVSTSGVTLVDCVDFDLVKAALIAVMMAEARFGAMIGGNVC